MAAIPIDEKTLATCKGKVVVVTGGANGIGAAVVSRFYRAGAHVFFSDVDGASGAALETSLQQQQQQQQQQQTKADGGGTCKFAEVDVTDYAAQLGLFDEAFRAHGRVDHAVYSAGVTERTGWLVGEDITLESVKEYPKPLMDLLDINLNGCVYFARIALAYLKHGTAAAAAPSPTPAPPAKSLTLISSGQAFLGCPGLCGYAASKHAMLGLVRSLWALTPAQCRARINLVAPSATDTAMLRGYVHLFRENGIPLNDVDDVALYVQQLSADAGLNGKAVYVVGGKGFDVEEGLERTLPEWLGKENAEAWDLQNEVFGRGSWTESK